MEEEGVQRSFGKIQMSSLLEIFTGMGEEKIFSDQGFFYREAVSKFFLGPRIFFYREGGEEKIFFLGPRIFLQEGWKISKVVFA